MDNLELSLMTAVSRHMVISQTVSKELPCKTMSETPRMAGTAFEVRLGYIIHGCISVVANPARRHFS